MTSYGYELDGCNLKIFCTDEKIMEQIVDVVELIIDAERYRRTIRCITKQDDCFVEVIA